MSNGAVIDEDAARLYEEARRNLLKNEPLRGESGESAARTLTAGELDALKAVGLTHAPFREVRARLREHSLFGIDYDGEKRLPRFQFERKQVLPGIREVIAALPADLNPLDVAEWFLSPNPDLEINAQEMPLSPREWLLKGHAIEEVVKLAQGFE